MHSCLEYTKIIESVISILLNKADKKTSKSGDYLYTYVKPFFSVYDQIDVTTI